MLHVPYEVLTRYGVFLEKLGITGHNQSEYKKWLRYFLDFRAKYPVTDSIPEGLRLFCAKLREKKQNEYRQEQAARAVTIYFQMLKEANQVAESSTAVTNKEQVTTRSGSSHYSEAGYDETSDSSEWDATLRTLAEEIKVRHYSRKTLKTYANWSRRFQRFLKNKPPKDLSTSDVKGYLTYLAVKCKVAASTQNQAFKEVVPKNRTVC